MRGGKLHNDRAVLLILSLALVTVIGLQRAGLAQWLDHLVFDHLAPKAAVTDADPAIVLIEIDQQSLERVGRWPWPRRLHARMIERLAAADPAVIGYDVLFAEPAANDPAGDAALVRAVEAAGVVVLPLIAEAPAHGLPPLEILPFGELPEVAASLGHSHLVADPDGRLRPLHLRAGVGDAYWPAFASAVRDVAGRSAIGRAGAGAVPPVSLAATPPATPTAVASTSLVMPITLEWVAEQGAMVPVPPDPLLRRYSAVDLIEGTWRDGQEPQGLAGAVILVGVTARGLQTWFDIGPATAAVLAPPIYFNAHAVRALLHDGTLTAVARPSFAAGLLVGTAFLPWLVSRFFAVGAHGRRMTLLLAPFIPLAVGILALFVWRLVLPFASVALVIAGLFSVAHLLTVGTRLRRTRIERSLAHAALTTVADAVLTTDDADRIDYANPAAERLLAPADSELVGRRLADLAPQLVRLLHDGRLPPAGLADRLPLLAEKELMGAQEWRALPLTAANGSERIVKAVVRRRGDARRRGHVIALNDITDERRLLDEVAFRATHDGLTKLPNRHLLIDRLSNAIERGRRNRHMVAAAFLDIDRLKSINDALGHAVGDAVLVEIAGRLTAVGRSSDTVGRLGGDEFVLLLENLQSRGEVEAGIGRYRQCLARPVIVDGRQFAIKASIGVACFPADAETADELLRRADAAMYRAKRAGRDQVVHYDAAQHGDESGGLLLDAALRQGIERDELELHYQPRIELSQRLTSGVESLVRWRHPEQGFLPPGRFISLAEETGSIVELGRWVLAKACTDLAGPALRDSGLRLSINVSVVQLKRDQGFVDFVRSTLKRHDLDPDRLELEITESLFLDPSLPMLGRKLIEIAALGAHLSIDDFGTGYSSLAYINRFPFDRIKIDRSFVHNAGRDKGAQAIIRAIVGLSEALAKKTTAEGVEETDQLAFLDELNCNEAQGYLFGRPVPLPELVEKLAA